MASKVNGNKFKGNKQKKGRRGRKEMHADYDDTSDTYGKIVSVQGGKQLTVLLLDSIDKKPVTAHVRGIHHRRVYFKKDDLVVVRDCGNILEIWGYVNESEIRRVRDEFNTYENDGNQNSIIFREANSIYPSSSEEEEKQNDNIVPPQQNQPTFPVSDSSEENSSEFELETKQIEAEESSNDGSIDLNKL